jgi:hypothetical protein
MAESIGIPITSLCGAFIVCESILAAINTRAFFFFFLSLSAVLSALCASYFKAKERYYTAEISIIQKKKKMFEDKDAAFLFPTPSLYITESMPTCVDLF